MSPRPAAAAPDYDAGDADGGPERPLPQVALRRAEPRRRCEGRVAGSPAPSIAVRRLDPYSASEAACTSTEGSGASTSTRRPSSSAVLTVAGPLQAAPVPAF